MDESTQVKQWPGGLKAVTLFAEDLAAARQFYIDVFGAPIIFEDGDGSVFKFGSTWINLLRVSNVPELIEPATRAPQSAGVTSVFTLEVTDVDATIEQLNARGVKLLNGPMDRPWGIRTASFQDPTGQVWEIAADL